MLITPEIESGSARHQRWTLDDIPWHKIDSSVVAAKEELLLLVASASFVEIATDIYARNLLERFSSEQEVGEWLNLHWQHEELQHGHALRRYVEAAWPSFDWAAVHRPFFEEFSITCKVDALEPTMALEMASRCVVEMGTASYYTTLSRLSPEPVLRELRPSSPRMKCGTTSTSTAISAATATRKSRDARALRWRCGGG